MVNYMVPKPRGPTNVPHHALTCLRALAARGLGDRISLGGAFGLLHYIDHRPTHAVGARWSPSATSQDRQEVLAAVEEAMRSLGHLRRRSWGDVVSIELIQEAETVFSFQIAKRPAQLLPSAPAGWTEVLLDSFPDLVASKMVALVERGAPRDVRDIFALCDAGLITPAGCWQLWQQ